MYRNTVLTAALILLGSTQSFSAEDKYADVRDKLNTCTVCHGENGASTQPLYPILAGQHLHYIYVQLKDFKSGLRDDAVMGPIASGLEKDEMLKIAEFFSEQAWPPVQHDSTAESKDAGLTVINAGQCVACHLSGFEGNSRVPRLSGQHVEYLSKTMQDYKYKRRNNAPAISSLLASFSEEEIDSVADYLAGFKASAPND